jgi:serine O-acetyltransferase
MALHTKPGRSRTAPVIVDPLWHELREDARRAIGQEPMLYGFLWPAILGQSSLEEAVAHRIAARLGSSVLSEYSIEGAFADMFEAAPETAAALRRDLAAIFERDPACERPIEPVMYFKGYHALQAHRLAHHLWREGRRDLALVLQSRSSEVFQTDIHPGLTLGQGVMLDHATGFVAAGEVVIEDDVSILQGVTLAGIEGERSGHPVIRRGSLIGADATILGPVEVGAFARVASGSVVLADVPFCSTVAGIPARVVGTGGCPEPARLMDQSLSASAYASFAYSI